MIWSGCSSSPIFSSIRMRTGSVLPDLSLQISPPSVTDEARDAVLTGSMERVLLGDINLSMDSSGSSESEVSRGQELSLNLGSEIAAFDAPPPQTRGNFHHLHHPQLYGCQFKRSARLFNGGKRNIRAPRMRWTTTLHAHFVHAVELLGGHESKLKNMERERERAFLIFL